MTFTAIDDTVYEDGKEVQFTEDKHGNITYTILTSEDEDSSEDPYIHSDNPEDLYYTNCAEGSDNEWEQFECDTPVREADPELLRIASSIDNHNNNHNNNIINKYFREYTPTIEDMLNLQSNSCMDIRENRPDYRHNYHNGYRRPPVVTTELLKRVDRFLSSKYACSSRDVSKPAGEFLHPVLSKRATYNTVDGAYIYNKIGLLDNYFSATDKFDDIVNIISERLASFM